MTLLNQFLFGYLEFKKNFVIIKLPVIIVLLLQILPTFKNLRLDSYK